MLILPPYIGHRGIAGYAPENTLASLRRAHSLGFTWVEFDVMLTADGIPIVMHDTTLKRTTNGSGVVDQTAWADLRHLDAGSWFSADFIGEQIPSLQAYLQCAAELGMHLNLEIKPAPGKDRETAIAVMQLLQVQQWPANLTLLISSFSLQSLAVVRALDSQIPIGILSHRWCTKWQETAIQLNCVSMHFSHRVLNPVRINEIKKTGRHVLAYTVNAFKRAHTLHTWGVDAVFTNTLLPF